MDVKFRLILSTILCVVISCSGEMFLEPGVYEFDMSTRAVGSGSEALMSVQKSMFALSEVGVSVVSCSSANSPCEFNVEWTIRQSDCDGIYTDLFQGPNKTHNAETLMALYAFPNCFYMAEEDKVSYLQSITIWPNPQVTVETVKDKNGDHVNVVPEYLHDLNSSSWDCSNRDTGSKPCNKKPFCGVGKRPSPTEPPSPAGGGDANANDEDPSVDKGGDANADASPSQGDGGNANPNEPASGNTKRRKRAADAGTPTEKTPPKTTTATVAPPKNPANDEGKAPPAETPAPKKNETKLIKSRVIHTNDKDGRFIFILSMRTDATDLNVTLKVQMKSPSGYLSATQYPLLPFYGAMCAVYSVLGLVWMVLLFRQWKDLLRIQFWISVVIVLGLIEKAAFVAEFDRHNKTGESSNAGVFIAEELSVLKRTMARMLVIVVSLGYGITRPRLGRDLNWVLGAGVLFFLLSSLEAYFRISQSNTNSLIALLPLSVLDAVLCWWIFRSLVDTSRTLRLRRNLVKLWLYRHFTNALIFCVVAAIIFLVWSLKVHKMNKCVKEWNEIWLDDAYWHILFCVILVVIVILFRPTANNQRYAYSVLSDAVDDDGSKEPMMSDAFDTVKLRNIQSNKNSGQDRKEMDDLQWVEDNIPAAVADAALGAFDDSEEELITSVERNKME